MKKKEIKKQGVSWKILVPVVLIIAFLSLAAFTLTGKSVVANGPRCKDSDGGIKPLIPGTCKNYNAYGSVTATYQDNCTKIKAMISSNTSASGAIREYYCNKAWLLATPTCASTTSTCNNCVTNSTGSYCCTPSYTCTGLNITCGSYNDGCGGVINCGNCPSGKICDYGKCVSCTPRTCANVDCGVYSDGCGGARNCGNCSADKTCLKGKCVTPCTPEVCPVLKYVCGSTEPAYYFCANKSAVDCGTCPTGQKCLAGTCIPA